MSGRISRQAPGNVDRGVDEPQGRSANRRRQKPALSRTTKGDSPVPAVGRPARPEETAYSVRCPKWVPGTMVALHVGRNRKRWVAPRTALGSTPRWMAPQTGDTFRGVNEPRGHSANRRRQKPALSRTAAIANLPTHRHTRFQRTAIAVINCRQEISAFGSDPSVNATIRRSVCWDHSPKMIALPCVQFTAIGRLLNQVGIKLNTTGFKNCHR